LIVVAWHGVEDSVPDTEEDGVVTCVSTVVIGMVVVTSREGHEVQGRPREFITRVGFKCLEQRVLDVAPPTQHVQLVTQNSCSDEQRDQVADNKFERVGVDGGNTDINDMLVMDLVHPLVKPWSV